MCLMTESDELTQRWNVGCFNDGVTLFSILTFCPDILNIASHLFGPSPLLCRPTNLFFSVNSVFSPFLKWKLWDTRVQIIQLAAAGGKKKKPKAISTHFFAGSVGAFAKPCGDLKRERGTATYLPAIQWVGD